jgi:hypothetical protein
MEWWEAWVMQCAQEDDIHWKALERRAKWRHKQLQHERQREQEIRSRFVTGIHEALSALRLGDAATQQEKESLTKWQGQVEQGKMRSDVNPNAPLEQVLLEWSIWHGSFLAAEEYAQLKELRNKSGLPTALNHLGSQNEAHEETQEIRCHLLPMLQQDPMPRSEGAQRLLAKWVDKTAGIETREHIRKKPWTVEIFVLDRIRGHLYPLTKEESVRLQTLKTCKQPYTETQAAPIRAIVSAPESDRSIL